MKMNKKILGLFLFSILFLSLVLPTVESHFFELHSLQVIKSCELATTPTAVRLCSQYLDVIISCDLADDWSVVFYFLEQGKFYRFSHSRQFYNNLLANAGNNDKLRACALGVGSHHVQDITSHGYVDAKGEIVQGYTGQTLSKFFITNALGHGPTERNMVNAVLEMDKFSYKGKEVLITQKDKDDALYYRKNGLNIFNSDPELVQFLFSGSEEIPKETIENAIGVVATAVGGGKQGSVFTN
ncbi:MAG: zinc dependent phospholipase C family protein, partial [Nanoarchaeota archaeon]